MQWPDCQVILTPEVSFLFVTWSSELYFCGFCLAIARLIYRSILSVRAHDVCLSFSIVVVNFDYDAATDTVFPGLAGVFAGMMRLN